ncbi:MAG: DUF2975 domain-containing protein [Phycisphaerales bacterium]|nr:DUF2975 domain-containing protein [Phycisphaerales bacterium]
MTDPQPPQFYIGPDSSGSPPDDPDHLLDEARERIRLQDEQNKESVRLARRLIVAFILIAILGVVFYIVLPQYGLKLNPLVPVLSFLAILTGAILSAREELKDEDDLWDDPDDPRGPNGGPNSRPDSDCNEGCAVGMCPGPRPLRMFRHPKKK